MQEAAQSQDGVQRPAAAMSGAELRATEVPQCPGPSGAGRQTGTERHAGQDLVPEQEVGYSFRLCVGCCFPFNAWCRTRCGTRTGLVQDKMWYQNSAGQDVVPEQEVLRLGFRLSVVSSLMPCVRKWAFVVSPLMPCVRRWAFVVSPLIPCVGQDVVPEQEVNHSICLSVC